ncbi:MAG: YIP1 family protein [Lachnospiraceae bacterium]|nr:YIP1 family protein [Lachnospiraceae bacterium]
MKRSGFQTMSPYAYPFYIMTHPKDGFQEMKMNQKSSVSVTVLIIGIYILVEMLYRKYVPIDLNEYDRDQLSFVRLFIIMVATFFIVTGANWCFCTLLDGKGKFKDICYVAACAVLPMILMNILTLIASRFLTANESVILEYPALVIKGWALVIFFIGLSEIHDYSGKKTFLSLILTVVGILIILFLGLLLVMLFQQLYQFVELIIFDFKYKM